MSMAYDRYDMQFHLTPNGWSTSDAPPPDRIETLNLHVYQASGWSREERTWSRIWENEEVSGAEREALYKKFGKRPKQWTD